MNKLLFAIIILLLSAGYGFAEPTIPNVFVNGTVADANKINENFMVLGAAINNIAMSTTIRTVSSDKNIDNTVGSEILFIACEKGEILLGGGCACTSENYDRILSNYFASVHGCYPISNGYLGYCAVAFSDWEASKYGPPIMVFATCAKITLSKSNKTNKTEEEKLVDIIKKIEKVRNEYEQDMINKMNGLE